VRYAAVRLAEDGARNLGLWRGCWEARSIAALLPVWQWSLVAEVPHPSAVWTDYVI
jgi:hypothetical protein